MKKLFLVICLVLSGIASVSAQKINYEVPPLSHKLDSMCREVVELRSVNQEKAYLRFAKIALIIQNKKDDLLAVGDYFSRNKVYPCDSLCAEKAYELDANDINVLRFRASILEKGKNYSMASQVYDMVLEKDSDDVGVLYQLGRINIKSNPLASMQAFRRVTKLDPNNWSAWRNLGDLYFRDNNNVKAIDCYDRYYELCSKDSLEASSCANYLLAMFSQSRFDSVARLAEEFRPLDPNAIVFKRMRFFGLVPLYPNRPDYEEATAEIETAMKYIADHEYHDSLYINLDFQNASTFFELQGDMPKAVSYLEQSVARDSSVVDNYKRLAALYRRNSRFDEAIQAFATYVDKKGAGVSTNDRLILMQTFLDAAKQDSIDADLKAKYLTDGLAICDDAIAKAPNAYLLHIQRANFVVVRGDGRNLNEESASSFVRAVELMQAAENSDDDPEIRRSMFNASLRLALYYIQRGQELDKNGKNEEAAADYAQSWKYDNIAYAIDPTHGTVKQIYDVLKDEYGPKTKPAKTAKTTKKTTSRRSYR